MEVKWLTANVVNDIKQEKRKNNIMEVKKGIWKVTTGKGDRIYINCEDKTKVMHPQDLCGMNGLGMYGYEHS